PRPRTTTGPSPNRPSSGPVPLRARRPPRGWSASARSGRGSRRRPWTRTPRAAPRRRRPSRGTSRADGAGDRARSSNLPRQGFERDLPVVAAAARERLFLVQQGAGVRVVLAGLFLALEARERRRAADQSPEAALGVRVAPDGLGVGLEGGFVVLQVEVEVAFHEARLLEQLRVGRAVGLGDAGRAVVEVAELRQPGLPLALLDRDLDQQPRGFDRRGPRRGAFAVALEVFHQRLARLGVPQ